MTIKERTLLLKIHEAVKAMTAAPFTTFAPQTGIVTPTPPLQPAVLPLPISPQVKGQG